MNKLLPLLHFSLLSLGLISLSGCGKPTPAAAIEKVLNRCAAISDAVNGSQMSASEAAYYIATEQQKVDVRDCPPEFRVAYQEHINAWRQAAQALPSNILLSSLLEGFIGGATGNYSMVGQTYQSASIALSAVDETYNRLVTIAAAYGARIPRSEVNLY